MLASDSALCSSTIRDKIIPHAVSWFTGEAIEGEEFEIDNDDEDDIDDDEDEDEEDDEDEEEDDDEDEEEEISKTKKKVLNSSLFLICSCHGKTFFFVFGFTNTYKLGLNVYAAINLAQGT